MLDASPPQPHVSDQPFFLGPWRVEPKRLCLVKDQNEVRVPLKVMAVLCQLAQTQEVVSRQDLLANIWPESYAGDEVLTQAISQLRKILGDSAKHSQFIETVPKKGYRMKVAVSHSVADKPMSPQQETASRPLFPWVLLGMLLVLAVGVLLLYPREDNSAVGEMANPTGPWQATPFTSATGLETSPDFSPDGSRIAFSAQGQIQVKQIGSSQVLTLTQGPGLHVGPKWFPDGKSLAFVRYQDGECGIFSLGIDGGSPQRLTGCGSNSYVRLSIHPSARWLAYSNPDALLGRQHIFILDLNSLAVSKLTHLPDVTPNAGDTDPAFSPDGTYLAFARSQLGTRMLCVQKVVEKDDTLTLLGAPEALTTGDFDVEGLAWAADGNSLIYSRSSLGNESLWRVGLSGAGAEGYISSWVPLDGHNAVSPAISPTGERLAFVEENIEENLWAATYQPNTPPRPKPLVVSSKLDFNPAFSPDGSRIAFASTRSGHMNIWVCDREGENLVRLTSMDNLYTILPSWSPDGSQLAFCGSRGKGFDIFGVNLKTGVVKTLVKDRFQNLIPRWSRDGKSLYFSSNREGSIAIWKLDLAQGSTTQVTWDQGFSGQESPDGKYIIYSRLNATGLWIMPIDGGQGKRLIENIAPDDFNNWVVTPQGIYFVKRRPTKCIFAFFNFQTEQITELFEPKRELGDEVYGFSAFSDRDGTHFVFSQIDRSESDIHLVEGFK